MTAIAAQRVVVEAERDNPRDPNALLVLDAHR